MCPVKNGSLTCLLLAARSYDRTTPSIETHLAVVRGLPTKKFLPECVNEKSSTERRS